MTSLLGWCAKWCAKRREGEQASTRAPSEGYCPPAYRWKLRCTTAFQRRSDTVHCAQHRLQFLQTSKLGPPTSPSHSTLIPPILLRSCIFTLTATGRITHAVAHQSLLAISDFRGQVTLVHFDSAKGKGSPEFSVVKQRGGEVLALELCDNGGRVWLVVASAKDERGVLEVFDTRERAIHRRSRLSLILGVGQRP